MKKLTLVLLMLLFIAPASHGEEKSWLLAMHSEKDQHYRGQLTLQARTKVAMMLMPEQEIFLRLLSTQDYLSKASQPDGKFVTESRVASATLEHYIAGEPNEKMEEAVLEEMLWTSGIGGKGARLTAIRSPNGLIVSTDGIPEKYADYYKNDLLYFPEKPVKIGDSWQRSFEHPVSFEPGQQPVVCTINVSYKLKAVDEEKGEAEVEFMTTTSSDHIIQNNARVDAKMSLKRQGTLKLSFPDCMPLKTVSESEFSIIFSPGNYIKSEEQFEAILTLVTRE